MKKRIKTRKLKRTSNERKQLFRNLVTSLVQYGFVVTSEAKAKTIKPIAEKLVTIAKQNSLNSFRQLIANTGDSKVAKGLGEIAALFASRPGGYLKIVKLGVHRGDNTSRVRLEWVEKVVKAEVIAPKKLAGEKKSETTAENKKEVVKVDKKAVLKIADKLKKKVTKKPMQSVGRQTQGKV